MRIFLSYSSHDRPVAETIALALQGDGHDVFFDREDLEGGEDYNEVIRSRVSSAELFIFLVSPESVREGAYALTELRFAREKWNHPQKRVLPVLIAPTPFEHVPPYLKSVTIFQPEGNVAAEVAAHVSQIKRLRPRYLALAAAVLVVAAVIGFQLWDPSVNTPPAGGDWQPTIQARDFVSRYVYPDGAIERTDYALDPTLEIAANPDSLLRVTRVAYGSLSDSAAAMSITVRFRNVTAAPLNMDFDHRFFSLDDDQGRKGALLYFCCASGADLLPPGGEREMQLIFAAHTGWSGKEVQAHRINFHVNGLLPLTSGTWSVPALATAANAP
jgi:hypothetical protein